MIKYKFSGILEEVFADGKLGKVKYLLFGTYNPIFSEIFNFDLDTYIGIYDNLILAGDFNLLMKLTKFCLNVHTKIILKFSLT